MNLLLFLIPNSCGGDAIQTGGIQIRLHAWQKGPYFPAGVSMFRIRISAYSFFPDETWQDISANIFQIFQNLSII